MPMLAVGGVLVTHHKMWVSTNLAFMTTQIMMESPLMVVLLSLSSYSAIWKSHRSDRMLELSISV